MRKKIQFDENEFCRMWQDGVAAAKISAHFGAKTPNWAFRTAHELDLRRRRGGTTGPYDYAKPRQEDSGAARKKAPRKLPPHPRWPATLDLRVFQTGGRYAAIAELSRETRRPIAAIQARWHLIRGNA